MFMYSTVWSYSKDILHHTAQKIHLVVRKFQGKIKFFILLVKYKKFGFFHLMHGCYCDSSNMIYKLSFSIMFVNYNPHIAI